jgi:hypothetical protein
MKVKIYRYGMADYDGIKEAFSFAPLPEFNVFGDFGSFYNEWMYVLMDIVDTYTPLSVQSTGKRSLPWMNGQLRKKIRKQTQLHKKMKQTPKKDNIDKYNAYRKSVKAELHKAEQLYVNQLSTSVTADPKRFWNYVKLKGSSDNGISTLKQNSQVFNSDVEIAEVLNNQFKSVFLRESSCVEHPPENNNVDLPDCYMEDFSITSGEVYDVLCSLDVHRAQGPDEILDMF